MTMNLDGGDYIRPGLMQDYLPIALKPCVGMGLREP